MRAIILFVAHVEFSVGLQDVFILSPLWCYKPQFSWSSSHFIVLRLKFYFLFVVLLWIWAQQRLQRCTEARGPASAMRKDAWKVFELSTCLTARWKCSQSVSDLWARLESCKVLFGLDGFKRPNLTFIWVRTFLCTLTAYLRGWWKNSRNINSRFLHWFKDSISAVIFAVSHYFELSTLWAKKCVEVF